LKSYWLLTLCSVLGKIRGFLTSSGARWLVFLGFDFGFFRSFQYNIVGIGIAGSNDHVYVWYGDGTVSSGTSSDLDRYRKRYGYSLPPGKKPHNIVGIGIAGSNDYVYAWYDDGTVSYGTSSDLDRYGKRYRYYLPSGKTPYDIVGMGIAGSNDHVYVWFNDGTVSSGTSSDLDRYRKLYRYYLK